MAEVTKTGTPTVSSPVPLPNNSVAGLVAGEAIAAGDACYIKGSDGKVWLALGDDETTAYVVGFAAMADAVKVGYFKPTT